MINSQIENYASYTHYMCSTRKLHKKKFICLFKLFELFKLSPKIFYESSFFCFIFFSFETVKHIIIIPFWISEHLISIKGQNNLANHIRIFYLPFYMIFFLFRNTDLDTDPVVPTQYFSIPLVNQSTFGKIDSRFIHFVRRDQ
jgi:hypothetical protein